MHLDDERQENIDHFEGTFLALFRLAPTLGQLPAAMQQTMAAYTEAQAEAIVAQLSKKKTRRSRSIGTALQGLGSAASGVVDAVARRGRSSHGLVGGTAAGTGRAPMLTAGALRPVPGEFSC